MEADLRAFPNLRVVRVKRKRYTNSLSGAAAASRVLAFMHGHSMERFQNAQRENAVKICEKLVAQRTLLPLKSSTKAFSDSSRTFYRLAPLEGEGSEEEEGGSRENAPPTADDSKSVPRRTSRPFFGRLVTMAAAKRNRDASVLSGCSSTAAEDREASLSTSAGEQHPKRALRSAASAEAEGAEAEAGEKSAAAAASSSSPGRTSRALRGLARMGSQALHSPLRQRSLRRQAAKKRREASSPAPELAQAPAPAPAIAQQQQAAAEAESTGDTEHATPRAKRRPPAAAEADGDNAAPAPAPAAAAPAPPLFDFGAASGGGSLFEAGAAMWQNAMAAINRKPGAPLFNFGFGSTTTATAASDAAPPPSSTPAQPEPETTSGAAPTPVAVAAAAAAAAPATSGRSATGMSMSALASLAIKSLTSPLRTGPEPSRDGPPTRPFQAQGAAAGGPMRVTVFGATTTTTTTDSASAVRPKRRASSSQGVAVPEGRSLTRAPRGGASGAVSQKRTMRRATRQRKRQQHTTMRKRTAAAGPLASRPPAESVAMRAAPRADVNTTCFEEDSSLESKALRSTDMAADAARAAPEPRLRCQTMAPGCRAFPSPLRHAMQAKARGEQAPCGDGARGSSLSTVSASEATSKRPVMGQSGGRWAVPVLQRSLRSGRASDGDATLLEYIRKRIALESLAEGLGESVESLVAQSRSAVQRGTLRVIKADGDHAGSGLHPRCLDDARPVPSWVRDTCQRIEECEIDKLAFHSLTVVPNRYAARTAYGCAF